VHRVKSRSNRCQWPAMALCQIPVRNNNAVALMMQDGFTLALEGQSTEGIKVPRVLFSTLAAGASSSPVINARFLPFNLRTVLIFRLRRYFLSNITSFRRFRLKLKYQLTPGVFHSRVFKPLCS
jgi:hypothetical protein